MLCSHLSLEFNEAKRHFTTPTGHTNGPRCFQEPHCRLTTLVGPGQLNWPLSEIENSVTIISRSDQSIPKADEVWSAVEAQKPYMCPHRQLTRRHIIAAYTPECCLLRPMQQGRCFCPMHRSILHCDIYAADARFFVVFHRSARSWGSRMEIAIQTNYRISLEATTKATDCVWLTHILSTEDLYSFGLGARYRRR